MNIIASLLKNFSPLPSPTSFHPQDGSESSAKAPPGKEKGFESVLSGLAQNSLTQNSEAASQGTTVAPQSRAAIRMAKGENGSAGQTQDGGSDANPDPNSNANPIIVKRPPTALQGANGAAPASDADSAPNANGNASPLSLLSSALLGGAASAGQGSPSPNEGAADNGTSLPLSIRRRERTATCPPPAHRRYWRCCRSDTFSARAAAERPLDSGLALLATLPDRTATTQCAGALPESCRRPLRMATNPQIALCARQQSERRVPIHRRLRPQTPMRLHRLSSIRRKGSRIVRALRQRNKATPIKSSASNNQPQSVPAPDVAAMAANAGVAAGVALAANLQTNAPTPPSSAANGQNGARAGSTERAGSSAKQQKPVDQSATVGEIGGSDGAVDPTAQAILVSQSAPVGFDMGTTTGGQPNDMPGAAQSQPLPQPQISNPVFTAAAEVICSRRSTQTLRPISK